MPPRGRRPDVLVDTSVAVAMLVADHEHHTATTAAVGTRRAGLAGHAAFETFSILTRLPSPARRPAAVVAHLIAANFPTSVFLSPAQAAALLDELGVLGIAGGSVYDALVGAAAVEHDMVLVTRDRRALPTYRLLQANVEVLAGT